MTVQYTSPGSIRRWGPRFPNVKLARHKFGGAHEQLMGGDGEGVADVVDDGQIISRCSRLTRGMSIHDLECSSTIQMATAFIVGTRCWNKSWSDEAIWNLLDRW